MNETLKKIVKIFLITVGTIAGVLLLLFGLLMYELIYAIDTVDVTKSLDNKYTLEMQSVGSPLFFGPADGRLVLKEGEKEILTYEFSVFDDGASISPTNWKVVWEDTCVEITISGEEQTDEIITINFDGTSHSRRLEPPKQESSNDQNDSEPPELTQEELEAIAYEKEIMDGYQAIYNLYFAEKEYTFIENYNAKGQSRIMLYEDSTSVEYLVYDRLSKNEACHLYVYYRNEKDETGAWSPVDASILDIFAYEIETRNVVSSGKKQWADTSAEEYQNVTGEP